MAAAVAVDVERAASVSRLGTLQFILGLALPLAGTATAHKAGLGLRRLPLHHVLCHKHGGGPLLGHTVDLTVDEDHDDTGGEEGHHAGGEDVPRLVVDEALLPAHLAPVFPL